jgi:hypothetical protein
LELLLFPVGLPIAQELTPTKSNIEAMGRPKGAAHGFIIFLGAAAAIVVTAFFMEPGHYGVVGQRKTLFGLTMADIERCWA